MASTMHQRLSSARWWAAGAAVVLTLSACSPGTGDSGAQSGGTITVGVSADPNGLDPVKMASATDDLVWHLVYDPLFQRTEFGQPPEPVLAESLTPDDDLTSWTLVLKPGVTFADGEPVDAEAVKYNIDRHIDPDSTSGFKGNMGAIDSVSVVDEATLRIDLSSPWANLVYALTLPIAAPTAWEDGGEDFNRAPVGSGPYELTEWVSGDHLTFTKRDDYWGEAAGIPSAYADEFVIQTIPDAASRQQALVAGEIDVNAEPRAEDALAAQNNGDLVVSLAPPGVKGGLVVTFHLGLEPLQDLRLREAFAYSIDREALAQLKDGLIEVDPGGFNGSMWDSGTQYPGFDPARAKEAYDSYVAENGPPPVYKVLFVSGEQDKEAQVLQAMWKEIGLEVELAGTDVNTVIGDVYNKDFEILIAAWGSISPHPDFQLPTFIGTNAVLNANAVGDPEIDAALQAARVTTDLAEQTTAYEVIDKKWAKDLVWIWTVTGFSAIEARSCIHGSALDATTVTNTGMPNLASEIWTECSQ